MTNPVYSYHTAATTRRSPAASSTAARSSRREYRGDYFFADYAQNWIKRITFDATGNVTAVRNFEPPDGSLDGPYGDIVDLAEGPDGSLWYVDAGPFAEQQRGAVRRIRNMSIEPAADALSRQPTRRSARRRWPSRSRSAGSSDPEGRPLTYSWDFGDGTTSTLANPSHTFTAAGRYTVRLTTSDGTLDDRSRTR